jgi:ribosomal protein L29
MNKEKETLKKSNKPELIQEIDALRREYFKLRLNSSTAHIKDYSQFKKLRRNIARAMTYLRQQDMQ